MAVNGVVEKEERLNCPGPYRYWLPSETGNASSPPWVRPFEAPTLANARYVPYFATPQHGSQPTFRNTPFTMTLRELETSL
jgi:hypothetical protein